MTDKLNVVNPFYQRVGRDYLSRKEQEKSQVKESPVEQNAPLEKKVICLRKEDYIYLPKSNIYVAKELSFAEKKLSWLDSLREAQNQGARMLSPFEFTGFLSYLFKDYENKEESAKILYEILNIRQPWRGEWLDGLFQEKVDGMYLTYNHVLFFDDSFSNYYSSKLDCLMENKTPTARNQYHGFGIDFESWLETNNFGLPTLETKAGDIMYFAPTNSGVLSFVADPVGFARISSMQFPESSEGPIGTRLVREGNTKFDEDSEVKQ